MILADKIINERKKNGWSQEELAGMLSVSRQSVSKWESAQAVPDLQKIIKMADIFGVSTDFLLKDEYEADYGQVENVMKEVSESEPPCYKLSMEEANEFLENKKEFAPKISNAITLFILSPVVLLFLSGMTEENIAGMTERLAVALGLGVLFVLVAIGVMICVSAGMKTSKFEFLEKEYFETEYGVTGMAREKLNAYGATFTRNLVIGIVLCIMSAVPLICVSIMTDSDFLVMAMVCLLLIIVSAAVNLIVRVGIIDASYKTLLQEGDYSKESKMAEKKVGHIGGIYWPLITAAFLAYSFLTEDWGRSWIIWPVAGVLFAAIVGIARAVKSRNH